MTLTVNNIGLTYLYVTKVLAIQYSRFVNERRIGSPKASQMLLDIIGIRLFKRALYTAYYKSGIISDDEVKRIYDQTKVLYESY